MAGVGEGKSERYHKQTISQFSTIATAWFRAAARNCCFYYFRVNIEF